MLIHVLVGLVFAGAFGAWCGTAVALAVDYTPVPLAITIVMYVMSILSVALAVLVC